MTEPSMGNTMAWVDSLVEGPLTTSPSKVWVTYQVLIACVRHARDSDAPMRRVTRKNRAYPFVSNLSSVDWLDSREPGGEDRQLLRFDEE